MFFFSTTLDCYKRYLLLFWLVAASSSIAYAAEERRITVDNPQLHQELPRLPWANSKNQSAQRAIPVAPGESF